MCTSEPLRSYAPSPRLPSHCLPQPAAFAFSEPLAPSADPTDLASRPCGSCQLARLPWVLSTLGHFIPPLVKAVALRLKLCPLALDLAPLRPPTSTSAPSLQTDLHLLEHTLLFPFTAIDHAAPSAWNTHCSILKRSTPSYGKPSLLCSALLSLVLSVLDLDTLGWPHCAALHIHLAFSSI